MFENYLISSYCRIILKIKIKFWNIVRFQSDVLVWSQPPAFVPTPFDVLVMVGGAGVLLAAFIGGAITLLGHLISWQNWQIKIIIIFDETSGFSDSEDHACGYNSSTELS